MRHGAGHGPTLIHTQSRAQEAAAAAEQGGRTHRSVGSEASGTTGTTAAVDAAVEAALDYADEGYEDEFEEEDERPQSGAGSVASEGSSLQRVWVDALVDSLVDELAPAASRDDGAATRAGDESGCGARGDVPAAATGSVGEVEVEAGAGGYSAVVWRRDQVTAAVLALPEDGWGAMEGGLNAEEEAEEVGEEEGRAHEASVSPRPETATSSETDPRVAELEGQLAAAHAALGYTTALADKVARLEAAAAAASSHPREEGGWRVEDGRASDEAEVAGRCMPCC